MFVVFLRISAVPFFEGDTWWHLTAGERILATKTFPTADTDSFTVTGNDWMAYEWLGEIIMAAVFRWHGLIGLFFLTALLGSALMLLLLCLAYLYSGNWKAAFLACLSVALPFSLYFNLRPQLIGYLFFLVTLIVLEQFRSGRSGWLWVLPLLFLLWVNTHGSFVFGFLALGVYWASGLCTFEIGNLQAKCWTERQRLQLITCIFACLLMLPLTPYGTHVAAYPLEMALLQPVNTGTNGEFRPLLFHGLLWQLLLLHLLAFLAANLVRPLQYGVYEGGLLLFAVYAALAHRRFVLLLVPVFVPLLAKQLAQWISDYIPAKDCIPLNSALLVLILGGVAFSTQSEQGLEARVARKYPQRAIAFLQEKPVPGPMLNEYDWGGYLSRYLAPGYKVFIDGRADIYEYGGVLQDYRRIEVLDPAVPRLLQKYGVASCLILHPSALSTLLNASPEWQQVYRDELSAIYVHKRSHRGPAPVIQVGYRHP